MKVVRKTVIALVLLACAALIGCAGEAAARDQLGNWARALPGLSESSVIPGAGLGGTRGVTLEGHVADAETARQVMTSYEGYIEENPDDFQWWAARLSWPVDDGITVVQLTPGEDHEPQLELGTHPLPDDVTERRIGFNTFSLGGTHGPLSIEYQADDPVTVALGLQRLESEWVTIGTDQDHYLAAATLRELHALADSLGEAIRIDDEVRYQGNRAVFATSQQAIDASHRMGEDTPWTITGGPVTVAPGQGTRDYLNVAEDWQDQARRIIISEREFEVWMRTNDDCNDFLDNLPDGPLQLHLDCLDEDHRKRMIGTAEEFTQWREGLDRLLATGIGSVQYSADAVRIYQRSSDWEEPLRALRQMGWKGWREVELSTETASVTFLASTRGAAHEPTHRGEPIEEGSTEAEMVEVWNATRE